VTLSFLIAANLVLLTRLFCLFKDEPARPWAWIWKCLVETIVLLACFDFSSALAGALGIAVLANLIGAKTERGPRRRNLYRLLIGFVELAAFSLFFSSAAGIQFHFGWYELGPRLSEWTTFAPLITSLANSRMQLFLFGLLLSANEANLIIRTVFDWLDLKPRAQAEGKGVLEGKNVVDVGEFNRGRVIGLLERVLLYGFILQGQYGAIGFVMAAKAFTRFKALDDRSFAEYVLIGTLLSGGLALLFGLLVVRGLAR
jgi:hypothetical protein